MASAYLAWWCSLNESGGELNGRSHHARNETSSFEERDKWRIEVKLMEDKGSSGRRAIHTWLDANLCFTIYSIYGLLNYLKRIL